MDDAGADDRLVHAIKDAYEGAAAGWASGPVPLYRRLARALLAASPTPMAGRSVLDLGAGTGVASEVLIEAGARPVAVDLALAMLQYRQSHRPPGTVADAQALPFRDGVFDAVVAAFCVNHLPDPAAGLVEARRVTRPGGSLVVSTFPTDADHPAKAIVEQTLERFGYRRPSWYQTFKDRVASSTGDADALAAAATRAGYGDVEVRRIDVDVGLDEPHLAVEWRLNMPHTIGFVAGLDRDVRLEVRAQALEALSGGLPPDIPILVLRGRVRGIVAVDVGRG